MLDALNDFEKKKQEIEKYFDFLAVIHKRTARVTTARPGGRRESSVDTEVKIILRANAFVMLYNLVESTICDCIEAIYDAIYGDSLTYARVRDEIQQIWLRFSYRDVERQRASHDRYMELAKQLVDSVVNGDVLSIDPGYKLGISGNIDAQRIREIARTYGFSYETGKRAKGGRTLLLVKDSRNGLAHGNMSFVECGRDHTLEDVQRVRREVFYYLGGILKNVKRYIDSKSYALR